jgi:hypothetical protein
VRQRTQPAGTLPPAVPFPFIVAIVGPADHAAEMDRLAAEAELAGRLPVVPHVCPSRNLPDVLEWNDYHQARLYDLALRRIDMADEVIVVGSDQELGDAIRGQIAYAESLRKPVRRCHAGAIV